jgi:hypothetical protein
MARGKDQRTGTIQYIEAITSKHKKALCSLISALRNRPNNWFTKHDSASSSPSCLRPGKRNSSPSRGSGFTAICPAPRPMQNGRFSGRDAHAFNRFSSTQVTEKFDASGFALVSGGFSPACSPYILSSHDLPLHVLFKSLSTVHCRSRPIGRCGIECALHRKEG